MKTLLVTALLFFGLSNSAFASDYLCELSGKYINKKGKSVDLPLAKGKTVIQLKICHGEAVILNPKDKKEKQWQIVLHQHPEVGDMQMLSLLPAGSETYLNAKSDFDSKHIGLRMENDFSVYCQRQ